MASFKQRKGPDKPRLRTEDPEKVHHEARAPIDRLVVAALIFMGLLLVFGLMFAVGFPIVIIRMDASSRHAAAYSGICYESSELRGKYIIEHERRDVARPVRDFWFTSDLVCRGTLYLDFASDAVCMEPRERAAMTRTDIVGDMASKANATDDIYRDIILYLLTVDAPQALTDGMRARIARMTAAAKRLLDGTYKHNSTADASGTGAGAANPLPDFWCHERPWQSTDSGPRAWLKDAVLAASAAAILACCVCSLRFCVRMASKK